MGYTLKQEGETASQCCQIEQYYNAFLWYQFYSGWVGRVQYRCVSNVPDYHVRMGRGTAKRQV